ncbi:MAG: YqaJ viral recombinase family protein, partial [Oricola sp.]|nr:YqaJ viral recombinase family protein [Oricola sp.]
MEQRSPEWFAKRAGCFTASRMSDLMARTKTGPAASRKNMITTLAVERLTGSCVETYQNGAMLRGIELEQEGLDAYSFECGVAVIAADYLEHPELPRVGCSPDGLVNDDGMVEMKCPA